MTTVISRRRTLMTLLLGATFLRPPALAAQDCSVVYARLMEEMGRADDWVASDGPAYLDQLQARLDGLKLQLNNGIKGLAVGERIALLDGLSLTLMIVLGVCGLVSGSFLTALVLGGIGLVVGQGLVAAKAYFTGQYSTETATEAEVVAFYEFALSQSEPVVLTPGVTLQGLSGMMSLIEIGSALLKGFDAQTDRWDKIVENANFEVVIARATEELQALRDPSALAAHRQATLQALLDRLVNLGTACNPQIPLP